MTIKKRKILLPENALRSPLLNTLSFIFQSESQNGIL